MPAHLDDLEEQEREAQHVGGEGTSSDTSHEKGLGHCSSGQFHAENVGVSEGRCISSHVISCHVVSCHMCPRISSYLTSIPRPSGAHTGIAP